MNALDIGIIVVIGASVIFGLFRGFIPSVTNTGGALISFIGAFWLRRPVGRFLQDTFGLRQMLETYTDSMIHTEYAAKTVAEIGTEQMPGVVRQALSGLNLPAPIAEFIENNLLNGALDAGKTVQAYVSEGLVNACMGIISFVATFLLLYIAFSIVGFILRAIVKLPVLKQADTLAGGIFGLLRGIVFVLIIFTLMPVAQSLIPGDTVQTLVDGSSLAGIFSSGGLVQSVIRGTLF